jgi:hypothetical protein
VERLIAQRPGWAAALALLLLVEQGNASQPARLSRAQNQNPLAWLPPPPADCRSFAVAAARRAAFEDRGGAVDAKYPDNVDAMYLAQRWRLPTINGYSTFNPPDWAFGDSRAPDYRARILGYAKAHRLTRLCLLDARQARPWQKLGADSP